MNSRWLKRWRGRQSYRWADRWPGYAAIGLVAAGAAWGLSKPAQADNFARVYYDANTGELVVTMRYRGTNPDHTFSLKWGTCPDADPGTLPEVAVEVLDDQWRDQAQREFKKTVRFSLADMPCRPAKVTLRTAPRFTYTVVIGPQP
jgi:hypothetical protein